MITDRKPMSISSHYRAIGSAKSGDTRSILHPGRLLYDYVHEAPSIKLLHVRFTAVMASLSELQATSWNGETSWVQAAVFGWTEMFEGSMDPGYLPASSYVLLCRRYMNCAYRYPTRDGSPILGVYIRPV